MSFVIFAAAGLGSRLNSSMPKPLFPIGGKPNIQRLLNITESLALPSCVVLGHRGKEIQEFVESLNLITPTYFVTNENYRSTSPMDSYKIGVNLMVEKGFNSGEFAFVVCADLVIKDNDFLKFLSTTHEGELAGVSTVRSSSGLAVRLNEQMQFERTIIDSTLAHEWGNFARVQIDSFRNANTRLLSEYIVSRSPCDAFVSKCIDIDTPADVMLAESLLLE